MPIEAFLSFVAIDLALVFVPGPDWLYVIARGLGQGRAMALTAVAGLCLGYLAHTVLAVLGLAAVLAANPATLEVLRYCGAAYLVYLGARLLLARPSGTEGAPDPTQAPSAAVTLRQSAITSILNPKGLLVYLSLLPQFIRSDQALPESAQMAVMGITHIVLCAVVYGVVGVTASSAGSRLAAKPRVAGRLNSVAGVLLLGVACLTGLSGALSMG
ncbi:LysE family translocator [Streptomyces sp. NRRL B-1347]|uniref:LysE family translocator n=1 Tax=Streptomyces sp. NRRL B-1347 TaxID=1476877 RepID=UPI0007C5D647|nr:LysE family translocator [Streptomyces sp. NRRL B-1347]